MKPTRQQIDEAKSLLQSAGYIVGSLWQVDDILCRAVERKKRISKKQAIEIAGIIDRRHDASIGINWDVIDCHIDMFLDDLKESKKKKS